MLKAFICHNGVFNDKGHYWAMVKEKGKWYKMDD
jgi:ubiquitin C-terminal hydrolase